MKKLLAVLAISLLSPATGFAAQMTGYISDDSCATKSSSSARATDWIKVDAFEECAKKCVKEGSAAVFVTEDNKIIKIDPVSSKLAMTHLGHRVSLTGTVKDGVLKVDTITTVAHGR